MYFNKDVQLISIGGKDNLKNDLGAIIRTPGFRQVKAMGIIRDANNNPQGAFKSIKNALEENNLPSPSDPFKFAVGKPKVGVAILPDENTQGELEDLCLKAIENEPAFLCVEGYFECLQKKGIQIKKPSKAKIYAYLSSKENPELRLGNAAKAKYFQLNHPAFDRINNFIKKLVEE